MHGSLHRAIGLGLAVLLAGCAEEGRKQGAEGGRCFPNNSCYTGLLCLSNLCVKPPADAGAAVDSRSTPLPDGGGSRSDAPRADAPSSARDAALRADLIVLPRLTDPCTPGRRMWCDGLQYGGWGQVACGSDGKWASKSVNGKLVFDCQETTDGRRPNNRCGCFHFYFTAQCCELAGCMLPTGTNGQLCPPSPGKLCDYCSPPKSDCTETGGRCIVTNSYETFCGRACSKANPQTNPCPTGYTCMTVKITGTSVDQCIPDDFSCYR